MLGVLGGDFALMKLSWVGEQLIENLSNFVMKHPQRHMLDLKA
jgi:hypothetical protein